MAKKHTSLLLLVVQVADIARKGTWRTETVG